MSPSDPAFPATVGDLFARPPFQFGMRGDGYLWAELRQTLSGRALPDNVWEFRDSVVAAYEDAVGRRLAPSDEPFHVDRFDPGTGMSAGMVMPGWWWRTGLPILIDRYRAAVEGP